MSSASHTVMYKVGACLKAQPQIIAEVGICGQRNQERILLQLPDYKLGNSLLAELTLKRFGPGDELDKTVIS